MTDDRQLDLDFDHRPWPLEAQRDILFDLKTKIAEKYQIEKETGRRAVQKSTYALQPVDSTLSAVACTVSAQPRRCAVCGEAVTLFLDLPSHRKEMTSACAG